MCDECPICYTDIQSEDSYTTPCKHRYHLSCIYLCIAGNRKIEMCPYCRQTLDHDHILKLHTELSLKIPGVCIINSSNNILLDLNEKDIFAKLSNYISIRRFDPAVECSIFVMKIAEYQILFDTGDVDFFKEPSINNAKKSQGFFSIKLDVFSNVAKNLNKFKNFIINEISNQYPNIINKIKFHQEQYARDEFYCELFNPKRYYIGENLKLTINRSSNFLQSRTRITLDQIETQNRGRFIITPHNVVIMRRENHKKILVSSLDILEMDYKPYNKAELLDSLPLF